MGFRKYNWPKCRNVNVLVDVDVDVIKLIKLNQMINEGASESTTGQNAGSSNWF